MKRILSFAALSIVGGVLAHVGIFYLIRIEPPRLPELPTDAAEYEYVGDLGNRSEPVLRQQARLFDSSPLFMPTRWNLVSQMEDVASLREATEVFSEFPARLSLPESVPSLEQLHSGPGIPESVMFPEGPAFVLSLFGRSDASDVEWLSESLSIRASRLDAETFDSVRLRDLPAALESDAPQSLWAPARFYLQVVEGKALGVPAIARSSGFSAWDQALQQFIGSLDFYRLLDSGYYRVTVYP